MLNTVLDSSTYGDFADDTLETVVVNLMDKDDLSSEVLAERRALVDEYSVSKYPTLVILNSEGREIDRLEGYDRKGPRLFVKKLKDRNLAAAN